MLQDDNAVRNERRVGSAKLIDKLLESRNQVLATYNQLASRRPFTNDGENQRLVQHFCQALVDYTAVAHFQLYRHFAENRERRKAVQEVADRIYPRIMDVTQSILDFNAKYDCDDHCSDLSQLDSDLSHLGEELAERIELEDELIAVFGVQRG